MIVGVCVYMYKEITWKFMFLTPIGTFQTPSYTGVQA